LLIAECIWIWFKFKTKGIKMKLLELYKSILSTGSLVVDNDGLVSAKVADASLPFMVESKRMVLPTREHLNNPDKSSIVLFHPLGENVLKGESEVMAKFRHAVNVKLNYITGCVASELMYLVTSVAMHSKLSPSQSEILSAVKNADEKTQQALQTLIKAMGISNQEKCFVHIYLKRSGLVQGKKYSRAAIVTFPLYQELIKEQKQVYGVTLRTKDRAAIISLLEYMFPSIAEENHYNRGSDSNIAPFLDALMLGLMGVASAINTLSDDFGKFYDKQEEFRYDDAWVEVFDNLAQLLPEIRAIPMQAGNEGTVDFKTTAHQPLVMPPAMPYQQPYQPMAIPFANQVPVASGPVKNEDGSIDFSASLRNNPQIAHAIGGAMYGGGGMQPMLPPGPIANRQGMPRWMQNDGMWGNQPNQGGGYNTNYNPMNII
jgi:hypothetical protein